MALAKSIPRVHEYSEHEPRSWWKEASIYQIYPVSFFDSNGDGIGDINGIGMKLDYIENLGIDTIWLSPVYKSPQVDMGYDISDYRDIHDEFGTMADMENLIAAIHKRKMKIVMDLVVNHTSDQHEWFQQSRSSKDNPFRNWYVWRAGHEHDGVQFPPNNWKGMFGGSTWQFDPVTSEYYLHCFAAEQPDLNWENPVVVKAVHDIIRFWLNKGVNGFRCDVINFISKAPGYPDAPITDAFAEFQDARSLFANGPRLHEHLRGIGELLKEYDAFSVGEMPFANDEFEVIKVVSAKSRELNMIFQFDIVDIDIGMGGKFAPHSWNLLDMKRIVSKWQTLLIENHGWSAVFAENHDQSRTVSRFASDLPEHRQHAAKMLATWLACQSGTLFIYQGQELGMRNVPKEWPIDEYKDIETQNHWAELLSTCPSSEKLQQNRAQIQLKARDNSRTPLQWADSPHGGFTQGVTPWMRANPDYAVCNAAKQIDDQDSVYYYWARCLALRHEYKDVLVYGTFRLIDEEHVSVFAYEKRHHGRRAVVVLNWSSDSVNWYVPKNVRTIIEHGTLLQSNFSRNQLGLVDGKMFLEAWEALVVFEESSLL